MAKYLGVLLIVLATIMLVVSYITETLVDINAYQIGAMCLIVVGVILHIVLNKTSKK